MVTLNTEQLAYIRQWTLSCYPEEMCGLLTEDTFIPCENVAEDKLNSFRLEELTLAAVLSKHKVIAIVHSHPRSRKNPEVLDTRTPSLADIKGQRESGIPWLIVSTEGEVVTPAVEIPRDRELPYVGRPFMWFVRDCYTLVQDYYERELGIKLKDHKEVDYKKLRRFDGIFDSYTEEYGFKEHNSLTDIQNGDLLLLDNAGSKRNHLGVFHEGQVLHQDMVSVSEPLSTFVGRINMVLRYDS